MDKVDDWDECVIASHLNSKSFPSTPRAIIISASMESYFGIIGVKFDDSPEVMKWVFECDHLMRDRLKWWADIALRFRDRPSLLSDSLFDAQVPQSGFRRLDA